MYFLASKLRKKLSKCIRGRILKMKTELQNPVQYYLPRWPFNSHGRMDWKAYSVSLQ